MKINIDCVLPNPEQPRTIFDQAELEALAQSITDHGLIQPIVVKQFGAHYILVDGERRLRASKMAGLTEIDATVKEDLKSNGRDMLLKALVANVHRSDLGPVDEAHAYQKLIKELGTMEAVADEVGVSVPKIYMRLSLLELADDVQESYNRKLLPLDPDLIGKLRKLNKHQQSHIGNVAAIRGLSSPQIKKLINSEMTPNSRGKYKPRKHIKQVVQVNGHFNALHMIGDKQLPSELREASIQTCRKCPLYDVASPSQCRGCPLPDFLRLVEVGEAVTA